MQENIRLSLVRNNFRERIAAGGRTGRDLERVFYSVASPQGWPPTAPLGSSQQKGAGAVERGGVEWLGRSWSVWLVPEASVSPQNAARDS